PSIVALGTIRLYQNADSNPDNSLIPHLVRYGRSVESLTPLLQDGYREQATELPVPRRFRHTAPKHSSSLHGRTYAQRACDQRGKRKVDQYTSFASHGFRECEPV